LISKRILGFFTPLQELELYCMQSKTLPHSDVVYLIGSFGASCVLIYGVIQSPLAQPRNLVGGHVISAIVGVTVATFVPDIMWLTASLSVSISIVLMQLTKHYIPWSYCFDAVTGSEEIKHGILVCTPVLSGVLILLIVALIFNNMTSDRYYPSHLNTINLEREYTILLKQMIQF
jgi:CBS-domain-containing membrane protein